MIEILSSIIYDRRVLKPTVTKNAGMKYARSLKTICLFRQIYMLYSEYVFMKLIRILSELSPVDRYTCRVALVIYNISSAYIHSLTHSLHKHAT